MEVLEEFNGEQWWVAPLQNENSDQNNRRFIPNPRRLVRSFPVNGPSEHNTDETTSNTEENGGANENFEENDRLLEAQAQHPHNHVSLSINGNIQLR